MIQRIVYKYKMSAFKGLVSIELAKYQKCHVLKSGVGVQRL